MDECIICFEETTDFVIFPCDHKVCVVCYPKLKRCPLCNSELYVEVESYTIVAYVYVRYLCYLFVFILVILSIRYH